MPRHDSSRGCGSRCEDETRPLHFPDPEAGCRVSNGCWPRRKSPVADSRPLDIGDKTLLDSHFLRLQSRVSELTFAGDAGTTNAGRPSRRVGFEFSNYYKPTRWLTVDADLSFARARYRDFDPAGNRVPGAVEGVASLALAVSQVFHSSGVVRMTGIA